ncbi:MAG: hypothetical protein NO516_05950 [Candidatus Methanomethylicia archaeon]|nr:hypothetical protein [Candidatus Methanomethylicia archaeon]
MKEPTRDLKVPASLGTNNAIEHRTAAEKIRIKISLPFEFAERLKSFIADKGLFADDALPVLIEYGLDSQDECALERLRQERDKDLPKIDSKHAVLRFQAYQYFMINQAITMKLNISLEINRRLKALCKTNGLMDISARDEWDGWGHEIVDELFKRYVFTNKA